MEEHPVAPKIQKMHEKLHNLEEGIDRRESIRLLASDPRNQNEELDNLREIFVAKGFFENFYQWRLEKRGQKKADAEYYQKRKEAYFGEDARGYTPSVKHTALTGKPHKLPEAASNNVKRVISGPILEGGGLSRFGRMIKHAENIGRLATGNTDARNYLEEKSSIKATEVKLGDLPHRIAGNKVRKEKEKFERTGMIGDAFKRWRYNKKLEKIKSLGSAQNNGSEDSDAPTLELDTSPEKFELGKETVLDLFSYGDILEKEEAEKIRQGMESSDEAQLYSQHLSEIASTIGAENVISLTEGVRDNMLRLANEKSIPLTPQARSISWALWDLAKYNHEYNNAGSGEHTTGDPFGHGKKAQAALNEIVARRLGIEFQQIYNSSFDIDKTRLSQDKKDQMKNILENGEKDNDGQLTTVELLRLADLLKN